MLYFFLLTCLFGMKIRFYSESDINKEKSKRPPGSFRRSRHSVSGIMNHSVSGIMNQRNLWNFINSSLRERTGGQQTNRTINLFPLVFLQLWPSSLGIWTSLSFVHKVFILRLNGFTSGHLSPGHAGGKMSCTPLKWQSRRPTLKKAHPVRGSD